MPHHPIPGAIAMTLFQRILLVAALTALFTVAGVGWIQSHLSPIAEPTVTAAENADDVLELPAACRDELAMLEAASDVGSSFDGFANSAAGRRESRHVNVLRPPRTLAGENSDDRSQATLAQAPPGREAAPRPPASSNAARQDLQANREVPTVRSAEWNTLDAQETIRIDRGRRSQTATLPVSVEEALPSGPLDALREADVLDVMHRLRSDAEAERSQAQRELRRRGFSEVDLELARQLFSPDAAVRKQLAAAVPRLASVNAAQWLMWLTADPQPEVRRAALTTLATTGDPALLDHVEAMARKDSDPQIQALVDQVAHQRDMATGSGGGKTLR